MSLTTTYYCVSGKTEPWTPEMKKTVGYYSNKQTALKVAKLVREINMPELPSGIDVFCDKYEGEVVRTQVGLRLKETPRGCITMIKEELDREEYQRVVNIKFRYKESKVVEWKFQK